MEAIIIIWGLLAAYVLWEYEFIYYGQDTFWFLVLISILIIAAPAMAITHIVFLIFDEILPEGWSDDVGDNGEQNSSD